MLTTWTPKITLKLTSSSFQPKKHSTRTFICRAESLNADNENNSRKKKIVVVGSGWAGLGAAHHLCNQGFDVTVLQGENGSDGPEDVGIQGFWYPYRNIFSLVDEIGIKPFTNWTKSAQYSEEGLEIEFPIFQDLPQLPTPLGTLFYTKFNRLPLLDRLTSLPLMNAVIDFDNTDAAWRKYDSITARELFKQFGCSGRLYRNIFKPFLQVGLFSLAEQCSAAATLGLVYYFVLAHQGKYPVFPTVWCRGTIKEKIFTPWMDCMRSKGCELLEDKVMTDLIINEEMGSITEVVSHGEKYEADAVVLAVGISTLQRIIMNSAALRTTKDFLGVLNLASIDVLSVKIWLDKKINIPNASNVCSGIDNSYGWTFFDLNALYDEHGKHPTTVLQADFYHANEYLLLEDEQIVTMAMSCLTQCIKDFENATVVEKEITRFPKSVTHFFPGSYKHMMRGSTSFPNLFMAGDWIVNRHGSWSQEKAYVTGLEAANLAVDYLEEGSFAKIIPTVEDEPHIQALRELNRRVREIQSEIPFADFFFQ